MGEHTKISWCDATFNPIIGCSKVSAGCSGCYAERDWDHRRHIAKWGPNGTRILTSDDNWRKPLAWNKAAEKARVRKKVFCASLSDVFEDWRGGILDNHGCSLWTRKEQVEPERGEFTAYALEINGFIPLRMGHVRARLFWLIHETPWLDWLLLTKRPENIDMMFNPATTLSENVWIGTTIENQSVAWRADELRKWRAKVRFLSCEPLLGALELDLLGIDWVIAGGESGPNARPSQPSWFRSLRDQCQATKTPYFFKQWGEHAPRNAGINDPCDSMGEGIVMARVGNKSAGCLLDGREWKEFPQ